MKKKSSNFFWASYADMMTSIFFVMLVLFVLSTVMLQRQIKMSKAAAEASEEAIREINQVVAALEALDSNYFSYDSQSMRYKLNIDITYKPNDDNILAATTISQRDRLTEAGADLFSLMENVAKSNPEINYLLIVEGNTQRVLGPEGWNYTVMPDVGYQLSFRRALSLVNFWKRQGIDFSLIENCEVLIAGSGYFGRSREPMVNSSLDSNSNRKFTIQITPKVGEIKVGQAE